ncbi:hypothetical protein JK182_15675 [Acetobacter okinawensis]|uniref:hypothetical protein n=1 Tax=Acetobacter okinawensis TaxID=1076594 RepID=UPI001BA57C1A|nr:hypothetical protein [Acetobacter okinawensis]MBS0990067.1 hypothetical protein [Acetobacter okinawensis]
MKSFDYASISIISPHKIDGYTWDGIAPESIEANIKVPSKLKEDVVAAIENYLVRNRYLPKNYHGITLREFPNAGREYNGSFYIENPGENALDDTGHVKNYFAVVVIQTGVQNSDGYYSAHPFLDRLDIWDESQNS